MSQPVHITNIFANPTRYSVDAVKLKDEIESNLKLLELMRLHMDNVGDACVDTYLNTVIASHEHQLAQLNEDLLINKII